ncbi:MAG: thiamine ABC transporter substrate binding subunit, partial [Anaerolineales bacterium]
MLAFRRMTISVILLGLLGVAWPGVAQEDEVVLLTHDSFAISEDVLAAFEEETGLRVQVARLGDAGTLTNQAVLSAGNPQGDAIFGMDNTFLSRALGGDIFAPYTPANIDVVPEAFIPVNGAGQVTPITYGDVCINYDRAYFEENDLEIPQSLRDLTEDPYSGLLVVQNPATSSPGLAFLLATIGAFGTDGDYTYQDFWADLRANDVRVAQDWTTAYYSDFSGASDGDRPLVVSYASSPPVELIFSEDPPEEPTTGAIIADATCFRQIEYAGVLRGAENPEGAQQL